LNYTGEAMTVIVDEQPLAAEKLGLSTVGGVLEHLQKTKRLVVNLLVDGATPDLNRIDAVRQLLLSQHTLFIETVDPREMAKEVLQAVVERLPEAEKLKGETVELLQSNQMGKAMEKLGVCFNIWHQSQDAIQKTSQLLEISLESIQVDNTPLPELIERITAPLRQIKSALESRDFVLLGDILAYETPDTTQQWQSAIAAVRKAIA
jgi:hypothetical protein